MPKTSSRAITSPSGTADAMEVLANVNLSSERPLRIDTPDQMVASILSKKLAAGVTHLLLDIPLGPTAKVRNTREVVRLRKLFEYVAANLGPMSAAVSHCLSGPAAKIPLADVLAAAILQNGLAKEPLP